MENERFISPETKEKPPFVYHASPIRGIREFEPRAENIRDSEEGAVVFATPDLALATAFLIKSDDSWTEIGKINGIPYLLVSDEARFREGDKGGAIYKFSSDSFTHDPHKGMGKNEWVSKQSVAPIETNCVDSAINAMLESGLQVFFVDKITFDKIQHSQNWLDILNSLKSENQKQNKNFRRFEEEE